MVFHYFYQYLLTIIIELRKLVCIMMRNPIRVVNALLLNRVLGLCVVLFVCLSKEIPTYFV